MSTELQEVLPPGLSAHPLRPPPQKSATATALLGALAPKTFDDALKMAAMLSKSTLVPKGYQGKPGDIIVAGMWGAEIGLSWIHSLKSIAVINGNAGIWGTVGYALMLKTKELEIFEQTWDPIKKVATCTIKRRGLPARTSSFSMEMAKIAGLAGKDTYVKFPDQMCGWRAFWRSAKPCFEDVFMGLEAAEELIDRQPALEPISEPRAVADKPQEKWIEEFFPGATGGGASKTAIPEASGSEPAGAGGAPVYVKAVNSREVKGRNGPTTVYWITLGDDRKVSTFSESFAKLAKQAKADELPVLVAVEQKGDYLNLTGIEFAPIPTGPGGSTDDDLPQDMDPADGGGDPSGEPGRDA